MWAGGCSFFQSRWFRSQMNFFLAYPPHGKGMAPAVWRPLLWSGDYLPFHRSSGKLCLLPPDVGFITSSGTTIFFTATLVFKVLSDHCNYKSFTYILKSSYKTSSSRFIWSRWLSTWRNDLQTQVICPTSFDWPVAQCARATPAFWAKFHQATDQKMFF